MDIVKKYVLVAVVITGLQFVQEIDSSKTEAQIVAEIQSMAAGIKKECDSPYVQSHCNSTKVSLDTSKSLYGVCSAMNKYIICQNTFCMDKTPSFTNILLDAMVIPYCTLMEFFPLQAEYESLASRVAQISHLCNLKPGMECTIEEYNFVRSYSKSSVCSTQGYYAACMHSSCLSPSTNLTKLIQEALSDAECALYRVSVTPRTTSKVITAGYSQGSSKSPLSTGAIVSLIQSLSQLMRVDCIQEVYLQVCEDNIRYYLARSTTVYSACSYLDSYVVCQERNCRMSPASPSDILGEQYVTYCGSVTNMKINQQVESIVSGAIKMIDSCTFPLYGGCDSQQTTLLTSTYKSSICQAKKTLTDCLERTCLSQSSDLKRRITEARTESACGSGGFVQVSVLGILMAAVIHYL